MPEFIVEVHVVVRARSSNSAEAKVTNALRNLTKQVGAENAYIADVRGDDDEADDA
jgi:hypothetical protein